MDRAYASRKRAEWTARIRKNKGGVDRTHPPEWTARIKSISSAKGTAPTEKKNLKIASNRAQSQDGEGGRGGKKRRKEEGEEAVFATRERGQIRQVGGGGGGATTFVVGENVH